MGQVIRKILVLGGAGMAGHVIVEKLSHHYVHTVARNRNFVTPTYEIDLMDYCSLNNILDNNYDYVINAVGVLNQHAEENPDKAIFINSYLPHFLAKKGEELGFKLIHISTDCVFSGKKGGYKENDYKDGIGVYADSKALGEVDYGQNVTIRTSIVGPELSPNGIGLFHWFMNQHKPINGFIRSIWSGVTTPILAEAIEEIIDGNEVNGIIHLTNNEPISKYELLSIFKDVFNRDIIIHKVEGKDVNKSLIDSKLALQTKVPSYLDMVVELKKWIEKNNKLYSRIY